MPMVTHAEVPQGVVAPLVEHNRPRSVRQEEVKPETCLKGYVQQNAACVNWCSWLGVHSGAHPMCPCSSSCFTIVVWTIGRTMKGQQNSQGAKDRPIVSGPDCY